MAPESSNFQQKILEIKPITFGFGPLSSSVISAFREATLARYSVGVPPTFATCFREAEFAWLERLKVDMRTLLHTDQEYEYLEPLAEGERLEITTSVDSCKERKGLVFFLLRSEVRSGATVKIRSNTTF